MYRGVGFIGNFAWAVDSVIFPGRACDFQAIVSEIGDVGTAIFSFNVSCHTFAVLYLRWTPPFWAVYTTIAVSWAIPVFLVLLGPLALQPAHGGDRFFGNSGAWCWISKDYQLERFL